MRKLLDNVADFHRASDVPVLDRPVAPAISRRWLRRNLIDEEVNQELIPALCGTDVTKIADALADSIYVIVGTALEFGIPLDRVWDEVHRSNMAKIDPVTGKVLKRDDGKVLKPAGWEPPDISGVLNAEG